MTLAKVRKIVGGKGHYSDSILWMDALVYEHSVAVSFSKGRVIDKSRWSNFYDWC